MASASPRPSPSSRVRLQKYLAACGLGSRRACETLIAGGKITVNGCVVTQLGTCIDPASDRVQTDGHLCQPERKLHFLLNKPRGVLCTCRDPQGRSTFLDLFPTVKERLFPVGRLDCDSDGLLIVTNDGDLALRLAHPRHEVAKTYQVRVTGVLTPDQIERMRKGILSEGQVLKARDVSRVASGGVGAEYRVVLMEGKKREVRRMFDALGLKVRTLTRTSIGPLVLRGLKPGEWRPMTADEFSQLAAAAGLYGEGG